MAITISGSGITSANILDGTIVNADINSSAAIAGSKVDGSFGKVLQVVSVVDTSQPSTTSTSFVSTGISGSITPTSSSSKILIQVSGSIGFSHDDIEDLTMYRGATDLTPSGTRSMMSLRPTAYHDPITNPYSFQHLDSPASTSSLTYTLYFKTAYLSIFIGRSGDSATPHQATVITLTEIGA